MNLDVRSKPGIMAKGRNVYRGTGKSPNPVGKNQHITRHSLDKIDLMNLAFERMGKPYGYPRSR